MLRRLGWMVVGVIAPEVLVAWAFNERRGAHNSCRDMTGLGYTSWTVSHGFYANMGGFAVAVTDGESTHWRPVTEGENARWRPVPVRAKQIRNLVSAGLLQLPNFSEHAINDKSKADVLVKGIACLQAVWLVIQTIARALQNLPISLLELVTISYVVCTLITYCCWWQKPFDVGVPFIIGTVTVYDLQVDGWGSVLAENRRSHQPGITNRINPDEEGSDSAFSGTMVMVIVAALFGGIHCIAWNFVFPTPAEQLVWRISAVTTTIMSPIPIAVSRLSSHSFYIQLPWFGKIFIKPSTAIGLSTSLIYIVFRIYLISEPFLSLRSVPSDIYKTIEWTQFLPHIV